MKKLRHVLFFFFSFLFVILKVEAISCGNVPITRIGNFPPIGQVRENRCVHWEDAPPPVRWESGFNYSTPQEAQNSCISYREDLVDKEMVTYTTGPCNMTNAQATCNWTYPAYKTKHDCDADSVDGCRIDLGCSVVQTSAGRVASCSLPGPASPDECKSEGGTWDYGASPTYACSGGHVDAYWCPPSFKGDGVHRATQVNCTGTSQFELAGSGAEAESKENETEILSDPGTDAAKSKGYCEDSSQEVCPAASGIKAGCTMKYQAYTISMPRVCTEYSNLNPISDITAEQYFTTGYTPAYCIHAERLRPYNSTWDSNFDVTQCKSSLQSKQCGYGNILVEGAYRGYNSNYGIIDIALRFWAADDQLGRDGTFFRVGLPTSEANPDVSFGEGSKNIYTTTIANINRYIRPGKTLGTVTGPEDLQTVDCYSLGPDYPNSEGNGISCGYDAGYLKSIYLYINTLQDNKKIEEHLIEYLKSIGVNTVRPYKPESYKMTRIELEGETYDYEGEASIVEDNVEITYIMKENVEVECDINDPDTKKYCKATQVIQFTIEGGGTITLTSDSAGTDLDYYDYCKKNRCYKSIRYTKICQEGTESKKRTVKIKIITDKTAAEMSVKPLYSCGSQTDYQVMYVFDPQTKVTNNPGSETDTHTYTYPPNVTFRCSCEPNTYYNKDGYTAAINAMSYAQATYVDHKDLKVYNKLRPELAQNNVCGLVHQEDNTIVEIVKSSKDTYGMGPYDSYDRSSVADISLAKVLNMCYDGDKVLFDYSKIYGVNTDICKIYCRDETNFYLENKTRVPAGMTLSYDMARQLDGSNIWQVIEKSRYNPSNHKSTPVYELADVGKIFNRISSSTDKLFTSIVVAQRDCVSEIYYDKPNEDGKTWQEMYSKATAATKNQLIYDLQNCNLYTLGSSVEANSVAVEYNGSKYSTIDYVRKLYECGDGLGDCKCSGDDKSSVCGAMTLGYDEMEYLGISAPTIASDITTRVSNISYCSDSGGNKCYSIDKEPDGGLYADKVAAHGSNQTSGNIPTNDYATFSVYTEIDFYNTKEYYSTPVVGLISETRPSENPNGYSRLPLYTYPTDIRTCSRTNSISNTFTLDTYYRYNKNTDSFTKLLTGLKNYSCSYDVKNDTTCTPPKEEDTCFVDGQYVPRLPDCPPKLGFAFKNVDLSNLFPSDRKLQENNEGFLSNWKSQFAINWDDSRGRQTQSEVEASMSTMFVTDEYLEYKFTLSQGQISELRKYNKNKGGTTTGVEVYDCENPDDNDGVFRNCKSKFLQDITIMGNTTYATVDTNYRTGISKHNASE